MILRAPWNLRYLQGHLDASFVNLTPGTRTGIIYDNAYITLCGGLQPLEAKLVEIIGAQRRAEEEQASRKQLRAIQRAFREALLALPAEEYDWFDIHARAFRPMSESSEDADRRACHRTRSRDPFPGLPSRAKTSDDGSSSNSPVRCSAWRCHRYRVSCGSAPRRSCGRSRGTARGVV